MRTVCKQVLFERETTQRHCQAVRCEFCTGRAVQEGMVLLIRIKNDQRQVAVK